jgi:hypothetical protein
MRRRAWDLAPLAIIGALAVLFFHKVLFGGEVAITDSYARYYPWRSASPDSLVNRPAWNTDNVEAYYPRRAFATRRIGERDLPLWDAWTAGGTPFFADPQVGLFYPPNWPLFLGDPAEGMGLFLLMHFALAGAGAFLFLRRIGVPRAAALVGGVAFMWNGFFVTRTGHPTVVASCSWLPWALLAFDRFWESPTGRRSALLALPIALSLLAGFPQAFFLIAYLVGALAIARRLRARRGAAQPPARALLLAALLAAGLCAVQLIPSAELRAHSSRERWDYATLLSSAQHPATLVRALLPEHYGSPVPESLPYGRFSRGLIAAIAAPRCRAPQDEALRLNHLSRGNGYFIQSYVSTQNYAGVLPLVLAIVGAVAWRNGWRWPLVAIAAVALLVALGSPLLHVYRLLPGLEVSRVDRVIVLYLFAVSALAAGGLAALLARIRGVGAANASGDATLAPAAPRRRRLAAAAAAAAFLLVGIDLFPYGMRYNVSHPRAALPWSYWEVHYLDKDLYRSARAGEAARAILPGNVTSFLEIPDLQGMNDLPLARWQELVEAIEPGVYARRRIGPLVSAESLRSPLLDLLGVRRLLTLAPRNGGAGMKIIERPTALERAFVVPRFEVAAGRAARLARLAAPDFDPRALVVLESPPRGWTEGSGTATITRYGAEEVLVQVDGTGGGLVLADNWYPGWRASIDGEPVPILRGDHALRVVALPPGRHDVRFAFRPGSLAIGAIVSSASAAAALALCRPRRRGAGAACGGPGGADRSTAA